MRAFEQPEKNQLTVSQDVAGNGIMVSQEVKPGSGSTIRAIQAVKDGSLSKSSSHTFELTQATM